jgi:hypothetical protein
MPEMTQMMVEPEVLDALEQAGPTAVEYSERLEVYDYAVASTIEVAEN